MPASDDVIAGIERSLGTGISQSYRAFLESHDGAIPESNCFDLGPNNASGVRKFIPAAEILRHRVYVDDISEKAYPVAEDACGNFIIIDEALSGAVFFWDHETSDVTQVAINFAEFLESLRPFDSSSIALKPSHIHRVWVDPEFRRRHPELFQGLPKTADGQD